MPAWLVIAAVMGLVAVLLNPSREEFGWFLRLRRPRWLTFERWIPLIWCAIYACFYGSALLCWNAGGGLGPMAGYLGLLVLVQSYTLLICRSRRLSNGTAVGLAGWIWGVALTVVVASHSSLAAWLLLPYLLWSPVGTFVTWRMQRLNR
jgi:benzodiazapine receptor